MNDDFTLEGFFDQFLVNVRPTLRVLPGQAVDAHLAEQGIQWSFSRISAFNAASTGAHARLGTVDCGSATFLCVGALQLALLTTPPFVHLSFSNRQRPSMRLAPPR